MSPSSSGTDSSDGIESAPQFFTSESENPIAEIQCTKTKTPLKFRLSITGGLFWWDQQWCGFKRNYLTMQVSTNFSSLVNIQVDNQQIDSVQIVLKVHETCWKGSSIKLQQYNSKRVYNGEVQPLLIDNDNSSGSFQRVIFSRSSTEFFVLECLVMANIAGGKSVQIGAFKSIPFKILKGTRSKYPTIPMYLERQKIQIDKLSTGCNDSSFICTTFNQFTNTRTISPTGSTSSWANVRDRSASADSFDSNTSDASHVAQEPTPRRSRQDLKTWDQVIDQALLEAGEALDQGVVTKVEDSNTTKPIKRFRPWE